jgi:predicted O-methyltransferase YrrM
MESKNKYRLLTVFLSVVFIVIVWIGWFIVGEKVLILALGAMLTLLMLIQMESHYKIQQATQQLLQQQRSLSQQKDEIYKQIKQIESLFSIFSVLKITHPLPPMGGWVISPDFGKIIVDLVLKKKPKIILEASSGVSTIIASYCLKQLGGGTVISLEEENKYAEVSNNALIKHGLKDIAIVMHAPLKEIEIEGKKWIWYDLTKIKDIKPIDMLIIDGPAQYGREQKMIRYPALPLLFDSLSDEAIIILDDADRKDEKNIVELWLKQFNCFEVEKIDTEKGTVILHRKKALQK